MLNINHIREVVERSGSYQGEVPMSLISLNPEINPRKHRNSNDFSSFCAEVKSNKVHTPISLRFTHDGEGLEVVAGNTRYDANRIAEHLTIPAIVRDMSDDEAKKMAGTENLFRANMSVVESADHAAYLLTQNGGDKEATAKELGWTVKTLDSRILLTHVIVPVREALVERQIKIGHAELLSTLKEDTQEAALQKVVSQNLSVTDTRNLIMQRERVLSTACFDKKDCISCTYNTDQTHDLFATSTGEGRCREPRCWNEKTQDHLKGLKASLSEEFNDVRFDIEVPKDGSTIIATSGQQGVGEDQANACIGCQSYGCIISSREGSEAQVTDKVCFDLACNSQKVAEFQNLTSEAESPAGGTESPDESGLAPESSSNAGDSKTAPAPAKAKKAKTPSQAKTPTKVKELAFKAYTRSAKTEVLNNTCLGLAIAATELYKELTSTNRKVLNKAHSFELPTAVTGNTHEVMSALLDHCDQAELLAVVSTASALLITQDSESSVFEAAEYNKVSLTIIKRQELDVAKTFTVSSDYVNSVTAGTLKMDCLASGFDKFYDAQNASGAFEKLTKSGAKQFKETVIKSGFDWSGFIPPTVAYEQYLSKK